MKINRLYTGPDGESHFEDVEVPLEDTRGAIRQSEIMKATGILLVEIDSNHKHDWHNAPRWQFVIPLEGECEIEIGDGTKRRFRPGDILLAEDTTGRGHISRVMNNQPWKTICVTLE